mgnify:CR=1 FL=1
MLFGEYEGIRPVFGENIEERKTKKGCFGI